MLPENPGAAAAQSLEQAMSTERNREPDNQALIREAVEQARVDGLLAHLHSLHPAEIADALESLPRELRPDIWNAVPPASRGEILLEVHGEVRQQLIEETTGANLLDALANLEMDELADLHPDLPDHVVAALRATMDGERRALFDEIRSYPHNSAGGLMDADAAVVRSDVELRSVLRYLRGLRRRTGGLPEHLDALMVVDRKHHYLGMLRLSELVSLAPATRVEDAMTTDVPGIPVMTTANRVARLFEDRDLISAAVVSAGGRLLGRITVDDVVDVMREQAEHEVMSRAGLDEATDIFAPVVTNARRRAVWLGVNLVNAFVAAWVIGRFEATIDSMVALAVLMPVVASMGGVAGNQTLTLVTRSLALEQLGRGNAWRLLLRELASGLLNGLFWSVVVGTVAVLWFHNVALGIIFGAALIINLLTGAAAGSLVPLALQRAGVDPALAGGVLLTAATDVVGFLAFLGLATLLL